MSDDYFVRRTDEHTRTLSEISAKTAHQLSTWLVLGNAGGIVLLLNWRQSSEMPATVDASGVYAALATGVLLSVLGLVIQHFGAGISSVVMDRQNREQVLFLQRRQMGNELKAEGIKRPPKWDELDEAHSKRTEKTIKSLPIWLGIAGFQIVFQVASAVCLGIAILTPLASGMLS